MPQEGTVTIPPAGAGKISWGDLGKSLLIAAIANILMTVYPIVNSGNWPTLADWQDMAKSTVAFIIAYLLKNVFTNNVGQLFAKDKPVVTVSEQHLEKLEEQAKTNQ